MSAIRARGTISPLDIARQAMTDNGLNFEGERRLRAQFFRRITTQLNGMARERVIQKGGIGRGV